MRLLIFIVMMFASSLLIAQKDNNVKANRLPEFKNEGEQEEYWATQAFENNTKERYKKYTKEVVVVDSNSFRYGDNFLRVKYTIEDYKTIFKIGILHPFIIGGGDESKNPNVDTMTASEKAIYNIIRIDTLTISHVEELRWLRKSYEVRRFRFLLWRIGMANPTLYFFELTNDKANKRTKPLDFIIGSRLTFFKEVSILI